MAQPDQHMNAHAKSKPLKIPAPRELTVRYDRRGDTLHLETAAAGAAVSVDVEGEFWLRMIPATRRVVGIEIEDFQRGFLIRHPDVAALWRTPPSLLARVRPPAPAEGFVEHLVVVLREIQRLGSGRTAAAKQPSSAIRSEQTGPAIAKS